MGDQWLLGGNWPIVTKNTLSGKAVSAGHIHTLMLEYYIPYTRFSLKGGYTGEEIGLNPGISASMSNLEIGGRYYFLPQRFAIQPYGGLLLDGTSLHEGRRGWAVAVITILQGKSFVKITIIDTELKNHYSQFLLWWELIYIFFLVLLSPWNIFPDGIAGKISGEIEKTNSRGTGFVRSNGMRQTVSVGVKVNFPFTITQTDGNSILQWLDEVIFGKE